MGIKTDVAVIGAGVGGTSIARELSKYDLDATLVEKEADACWGATKASCAIFHPGAKWTPGTLAQNLIAESNQIIDGLVEELDIQFRRIGEIVLAFNENELDSLGVIKSQGERINAPGLEIIDKKAIQRLEPNVNPDAIGALHMPSAGVVNPLELAFAFCENATENGVRLLFNAQVMDIRDENREFILETTAGEIRSDYVVNAAGLYAEQIAKMAGADDFKVFYGKGSIWILDKNLGETVSHVVMGLADLEVFSRIKLVTPTFHENLMIYRTIPEPAKGIDDVETEKRIFETTLETAKFLIPGIEFEDHIIASFAGVVAVNDRGDFVLEASEKNPRFINAALAAPGVTCAPAVGKRVVEILRSSGLTLNPKPDFKSSRKGIRRLVDLPDHARVEIIQKQPNYGHVVCRCESVTEGEIIEAIRRGATTMDGVKFRVRTGSGRCQGNFCGPKVAAILARELNRPLGGVTKKGIESNYFA